MSVHYYTGTNYLSCCVGQWPRSLIKRTKQPKRKSKFKLRSATCAASAAMITDIRPSLHVACGGYSEQDNKKRANRQITLPRRSGTCLRMAFVDNTVILIQRENRMMILEVNVRLFSRGFNSVAATCRTRPFRLQMGAKYRDLPPLYERNCKLTTTAATYILRGLLTVPYTTVSDTTAHKQPQSLQVNLSLQRHILYIFQK